MSTVDIIAIITPKEGKIDRVSAISQSSERCSKRL